MAPFSREELESEFADYQQRGRDAVAAGDWSAWADQFTDDATYIEHAFGEFRGREAIRRWITRTMSVFPGNHMPSFPIKWHVVDEERGWIVCEIGNVMEDPGDGSIHEATNLTILHYAGDGQWSYEEDVYNPADFARMLERWRQAADAAGKLPDDARQWFGASR